MPINIPTRTFDDIVRDSKLYLTNNSKIKNLNRTSTAKLLLDAVAFEQEEQYDFQRIRILNAYLSTATGDYLDEIGYMFNVIRNEQQKATDTTSTNFRFFIDPVYGKTVRQLIKEMYSPSEIQDLIDNGYSNNGTDLIIPSNIKITNQNKTITYITDSAITLSGSSLEGYTPISAESAGETYNIAANVLSKHTLSNIPELRKIANFFLCENKFGITNGEEFESDENYRWRIRSDLHHRAFCRHGCRSY